MSSIPSYDTDSDKYLKPNQYRTQICRFIFIFVIILLIGMFLGHNLSSFLSNKKFLRFDGLFSSRKIHHFQSAPISNSLLSSNKELGEDSKLPKLHGIRAFTYNDSIELNNGKKIPKKKGQKNTIFIAIASFRDQECDDTITDLYNKADHPENIYVGACEQNRNASEGCIESETMEKYSNQIRYIHIPSEDAKGPVYGRFLSSMMYRGEDWFVQIDSHLTFVPGWDTRILRWQEGCPSKRCVFSHYPADVLNVDPSSPYHSDVWIMCKSHFNHDDILVFGCDVWPLERTNNTYIPVPFTGAGFLFGPGSLVRDVPYDPNLPFLFHGEEILHSARIWTAGYDIYNPWENVIYHHYGRPGKPKVWGEPEVKYNDKWSLGKVKYYLKQDKDLKKTAYWQNIPAYDQDMEKYGPGKVRTIEQYWEYAGITMSNRTSRSREIFCGLVEEPEKEEEQQ